MEYTVESAAEKLLKSYQTYYNIKEFEEGSRPLRAVCEYFETSRQYVLSKKAELWAENSEEFLFLFQTDRLTLAEYEKCRDYAYEEGMKKAHIGPGHMYTYITPVFICNTCDEDACKALKKTRIFKSFRFSFHGWMDLHAVVLEVQNNKISSNAGGRSVEKGMKKVLFNTKKKRSGFLK